jgi:hypothetical protein
MTFYSKSELIVDRPLDEHAALRVRRLQEQLGAVINKFSAKPRPSAVHLRLQRLHVILPEQRQVLLDPMPKTADRELHLNPHGVVLRTGKKDKNRAIAVLQLHDNSDLDFSNEEKLFKNRIPRALPSRDEQQVVGPCLEIGGLWLSDNPALQAYVGKLLLPIDGPALTLNPVQVNPSDVI